jgi:hypothetical protein
VSGGRGALGGALGLRLSSGGERVQPATLPNTRVQRTRSSASRRHSPLTRSPLGALGIATSIWLTVCGCAHPVIDYGFAVRGLVRDEQSRPIPHAHVVLEIAPSEPTDVTHGEAWTDERGEFIFDLVTRGVVKVYSLQIAKDGYQTVALESPDSSGSVLVVLKAAV